MAVFLLGALAVGCGPDPIPAAEGGERTDAGPCVSENDAEFCQRWGKECELFSHYDNCFVLRAASCGECVAPNTCGGDNGGTSNVCGCYRESDQELCAATGATCGERGFTDSCLQPRTVDCGQCEAPETCGGAASTLTCGCTPTTCEAENVECGIIQDGCGELIDCGNTCQTDCVQGVCVDVVRLSVGHSHNCVVLAGGGAQCWGGGEFGKLGTAVVVGRNPEPVPYLANVHSIAAGGNHTCAILSDATLTCWGKNVSGELGRGFADSSWHPQPGVVPDLSGVAQIALGWAHSCALSEVGTMTCWGSNYAGALGDGTETHRYSPTPVPGLNNITGMALGIAVTCAVVADGTLWCWGHNDRGQTGSGTGQSVVAVPTQVTSLANVIQVSTSDDHTCAVVADGAAYCWGYNGYGKLGNGTFASTSVPIPVSGMDTAVEISAGTSSTCSLQSDSTGRCWGQNSLGQLGDGTMTNQTLPVPIAGISNAITIQSGWRHACALLADARVQCWGWNTNGQLGDGTTIERSIPADVVW